MQTLGEGIGFALIAIATGVAITRYKLYEIERLVSRTVSYAVVLVALAGLYTGILFGLAGLVPADLGQVGVAAATLLVSIVAVPLTRRVRRIVDRRFNRSRFDAERVAGAFAARLRARPERGDVPTDLLEVVQRTVAPAHAGVWLVPTSGPAEPSRVVSGPGVRTARGPAAGARSSTRGSSGPSRSKNSSSRCRTRSRSSPAVRATVRQQPVERALHVVAGQRRGRRRPAGRRRRRGRHRPAPPASRSTVSRRCISCTCPSASAASAFAGSSARIAW